MIINEKLNFYLKLRTLETIKILILNIKYFLGSNVNLLKYFVIKKLILQTFNYLLVFVLAHPLRDKEIFHLNKI
jgi:hypothetical protein